MTRQGLAGLLAGILLAGGASPSLSREALLQAEREAPVLSETRIESLLGRSPAEVAAALEYDPSRHPLILQYAGLHDGDVFHVYTPRYITGGEPTVRWLGEERLSVYSPLGFVFTSGGLTAVTNGPLMPDSKAAPGRLPFAEVDFGRALTDRIEANRVPDTAAFVLRGELQRETTLGDEVNGALTGITFGIFAVPLAVVSLPIVAVGEALNDPIEQAAANDLRTAQNTVVEIEVGATLPELGIEVKTMPRKLFGPRDPRAYGDPETDFQIYVFGPTNGDLYHVGVRGGVVEWMTGPIEGWLRPSMCLAAQPAYGDGFFGLNCTTKAREFRY